MITSYIILNGPNLNLVGVRNRAVYGEQSLSDYLATLGHYYDIIVRQTNHEGVLIDLLHEYGFGKVQGIVLNAGGYSHTSVALRDAVEAISVPVVEVHISDIYSREPFRHTSLLTDVCAHSIIGHGLPGYREALEWLKENVTQEK